MSEQKSTRQTGMVLALVLISLSSCSDEFEQREERVARALQDNADGSSFGADAVWLTKMSSMAPNDRTAVFFGYNDNFAACTEFVEAYESAFSAENYHCDIMD